MISGILYGLFWCVSPICYIKFLIIKPTRRTNFSNLFLEWNSTCFGQSLSVHHQEFFIVNIAMVVRHTGLLTAFEQDQDGTSWSCLQAVSKPIWHIPSLCVQWKTPDDGQRNCPKLVELPSKISLRTWCIWLVYYKKFVTMHGHMNVKKCRVAFSSRFHYPTVNY